MQGAESSLEPRLMVGASGGAGAGGAVCSHKNKGRGSGRAFNLRTVEGKNKITKNNKN